MSSAPFSPPIDIQVGSQPVRTNNSIFLELRTYFRIHPKTASKYLFVNFEALIPVGLHGGLG
jgi:hypothetical protein